MKVSLIQMDVAFAAPEENYKRTDSLLRQAAENEPDVMVLPEMWNVGFFPRTNLDQLADDNGGDAKRLIGMAARFAHTNVVAGSVARRHGGNVYNTSYAVDRAGAVRSAYDKIHLFSPMEEDRFFSPGDHLGLFQLDGVNCGTVICYDIRFPEQTRAMALQGMDVLFLVSQWPAQRIETLHTLVKARAIENQCFAVCCNACGKSPEAIFGGGSLIVGPQGNVIAQADETEQILTAELDLFSLPSVRSAINVFRDRVDMATLKGKS